VSWEVPNPSSNPDVFQLDELTGLTIHTDDAEEGTGLWEVDGFTLSTARSHSPTHSYRCRYYSNEDVSSMTSAYPLQVTSDMDLSFWCWYDIETQWDFAFVEVSTDGRFYEILDTFTGSSGGWVQKQYELSPYEGDSIFIRFRYTTDAGTLDEGFYVDDITPVPSYDSVTTLSSSIEETSYEIMDKPEGVYYYRVKGHNPARGWCDFSTLTKVEVPADGFWLNLNNFPAYTAMGPDYDQMCGPAVAQMTLNYIWWNSSQDDDPPLLFDNQQWLYDRGIENNSDPDLPYLDTQGLWKIIQYNKPEPYSEYGYNFLKYGDQDIDEMLKRICLWINYTIGTAGGYKPGHPLHVPALVPTFGDYTNWMAIRGIHTDKEAYPIQQDLNVYGFWVNDPYPGSLGGLGQNSYKAIDQWLDIYYQPMVTNDMYNGKYVALFEPPETTDFTLHITAPSAVFNSWQQQLMSRSKSSPSLEDMLRPVIDRWVIQAALEGVETHLLPYDDDFASVYKIAVPDTPVLVENLAGDEYYVVPFTLPNEPRESTVQDDDTVMLVLVDASDGSFQEASWVAQPVEYLPVSEQDAYQIVKRYCEEQGIALKQQWSDATLVYRQGSPYYPEWKLTMESVILYVAQDESVTMAT
jgi:hypothetical protein